MIDMSIKKDSTVSLRIGGREWFAGYMGIHDKHIAVKIRDVQGEPRSAFAAVLDDEMPAEEEIPEYDLTEELLEPEPVPGQEFMPGQEFVPGPELDEGGSMQEDGQ